MEEKKKDAGEKTFEGANFCVPYIEYIARCFHPVKTSERGNFSSSARWSLKNWLADWRVAVFNTTVRFRIMAGSALLFIVAEKTTIGTYRVVCGTDQFQPRPSARMLTGMANEYESYKCFGPFRWSLSLECFDHLPSDIYGFVFFRHVSAK